MLAGLVPAGSSPCVIAVVRNVDQVQQLNQTTLLLHIPQDMQHVTQLGIQHILAVLVPKRSGGDVDGCKELQVLRAFQEVAEGQQLQPGKLWLARRQRRGGTLVMRAWGLTMPVQPTSCAWLSTAAGATIE
jgi:hypothetical protein